MILNKEKKKVEFRPYLLEFGLIGFSSESNVITLDKNHIIKRASKKKVNDFYKRTDYSDYTFHFINSELFLYYHYKQNRYDKNQVHQFQAKVEKRKNLFIFFSLFKESEFGLLYCQKYVKFPNENKYTGLGFFTLHKDTFYQSNTYSLSKSEIKRLKQLWTNYIGINHKTNKAFSVVLNRYYYSFDRSNPEDQLIDLMIAFEAFFLTDSAELSFKLALRVSKFLEKEYKSEKAFTFMKKAYTLRSKIVHGAEIKNKDLKINGFEYTIEEVVTQLRALLRSAINLYLMNYDTLSISKLIDSIDNAIIK